MTGQPSGPSTLGTMLVAREGLSPLMVGRDGELEELRRRFASVSGSETPPVVIVSGEAGVGKTRLLREFAQHVTAQGGTVLAGGADETTLAPPFEVLRDLVQSAVTPWDELPEALEPRRHALGHVLSPLLPEPPGHRDDHEHTPDELLRAAVDLLLHVVGDAPTVLVFEDLHWGDAESIALFSRLAATPGLPALLVGTFRAEDFDRRHPLARALPALERRHSVVHLSLGRLDERALARLLEVVFGRPVPTTAVAPPHRRTQGNPFFVEELVAGCGCDDPAELALAPLPWNAAEAVLRRVDDLEPETRGVLDTASLLGTRIPFDLLEAVAEQDEDELIDRLRVLVDRGLLVESDVDVFGFRHALTREAVAGQMLGRQQRRVHEAALRALEAQGSDDVAALAQHAAGARQWSKLVTYARDGAARQLREGAGLQALQLAELGLRLADELDVDDELALRSAAAQAAWMTGALEAANHHTDQWIRLAAHTGRPDAEAAAWRHQSLLWLHVDDRYRMAVDRARTIAEALGPCEELAWCYAFTSQAHMLAKEDDAAGEWADRALAMADEVGAPSSRPAGAFCRMNITWKSGV